MPKHEHKICPACGMAFVCRQNQITHCGCSHIRLTEEVLLHIQTQYSDCLCPGCLQQLSASEDTIKQFKKE